MRLRKKLRVCLAALLLLGAWPAAKPAMAYIVYSRANGADRTIWVSSGDGRYDQPLTEGSWPRVSRDGHYMVFLRGYDPSNVARGSLYLRNLLTGKETLLFSNNDYIVNYDFSPDTTHILLDYQCGIYEFDLSGTNTVTKFNVDCYDDGPQWNPAGTEFAFQNQNHGIGLASANGTNRHFIPNTAAGDLWPAWSHDGVWISFLRGKDLYKIKPDGTGLTRLTTLTGTKDAFNPARDWSADNSYLIAPGTVNGVVGLYKVLTNGSETITPVQTAAGPAPDLVGSLTAFPDTDGDGVPDFADACPGTPAGTPVDAAGCPLGCFSAPANLVAWWRGEGNTTDVKGTAAGTPQGSLTYATGKVGQAFALNGTNACVLIPDSPTVRPASLTIEGWVNYTAAPAGAPVLFGKAAGPVYNDSFAVWTESGFLRAAIGTPGTEGPLLAYPWAPPLNTWHHVAYTVDPTASYQALYLDGVLRAASTENLPVGYDTHPMLIGADYYNEAISQCLPGLIDEVSLYNRALSATEISGIYAAGAAGKCVAVPHLTIVHLLRAAAGLEKADAGDFPTYDANGDLHITVADVVHAVR